MISFSDIKAGIDSVQAVANKVKNAELNEKILELHNSLFELYSEYATERERRERAESKIKELEATINQNDSVVLREAMLWKTDENGKETGPFCSCCREVVGRLIPMKTLSANGHFECPHCKTSFQTEAYRQHRRNNPPQVLRM